MSKLLLSKIQGLVSKNKRQTGYQLHLIFTVLERVNRQLKGAGEGAT